MDDLVKKWKLPARRDDLFNHMVPSDVRQLVLEIERLRAALKRVTTENVRTYMTAIRPEDQLRNIAHSALSASYEKEAN